MRLGLQLLGKRFLAKQSWIPSHLIRQLMSNPSAMEPLRSDPQETYLPVYTRILETDPDEIGTFEFSRPNNYLAPWTFTPSAMESGANLLTSADALQTSLYPVAFPTETVYGLGANALSSAAVQGIYKAKQRPSDNPLIVHVSSLEMLRRLLDPLGTHELAGTDPIPSIYTELIQNFWPGPLSILLPNPDGSRIAKEVTAGQPTFAARMPSDKLALALIQLCRLPLAAPSANASTKPSPTTAQHVAHDLAGRIEFILDGGTCTVGVESTVVDGLSSPPAILRPGGIGIDKIRRVRGWEDVVIGYADAAFDSSRSAEKPRAPGMKYKHYSPAARVVLSDVNVDWTRVWSRIEHDVKSATATDIDKIGIIKTRRWTLDFDQSYQYKEAVTGNIPGQNGIANGNHANSHPKAKTHSVDIGGKQIEFHILDIGPSTASIARGLFSALRDLDLRGVQSIYVEGIDDGEKDRNGSEDGDGLEGSENGVRNGSSSNQEGQTAAAIMNRLRKAAAGDLITGKEAELG